MSAKLAITLIGSGNVAWHIGQGLAKSGHRIDAVYSRNKAHAEALAGLFQNCLATDRTDFSKSSSAIFIAAVSDSGLESLVSALTIPDKAILVHTSGSMPMEMLNRFPKHGVFYPLQTFTKEKVLELSGVPFGIEASDETTYQTLATLALSLSTNVRPISSAQRRILHVAAVFACNFTNHLLSVSENILKKENLDVDLLKPLIRETFQKAFEIGPQKAQTGPAIRGDEKIMQQHLDYLRNEPELQQLYRMLSEGIKAGK